MAKPARLKVYRTADGFYDALVAAPIQAAALRAWGTTTNLFVAGRADVAFEDDASSAEALARPGEVIKRPRGDAAEMLASASPALARAEPPRQSAPTRQPVRTRKLPPPPDRSELDAAERVLAEAEREIAAERDALAAEQVDLDRRQAEMRARSRDTLKAVRGDRDRAKAAFERASAQRR